MVIMSISNFLVLVNLMAHGLFEKAHQHDLSQLSSEKFIFLAEAFAQLEVPQ